MSFDVFGLRIDTLLAELVINKNEILPQLGLPHK